MATILQTHIEVEVKNIEISICYVVSTTTSMLKKKLILETIAASEHPHSFPNGSTLITFKLAIDLMMAPITSLERLPSRVTALPCTC